MDRKESELTHLYQKNRDLININHNLNQFNVNLSDHNNSLRIELNKTILPSNLPNVPNDIVMADTVLSNNNPSIDDLP